MAHHLRAPLLASSLLALLSLSASHSSAAPMPHAARAEFSSANSPLIEAHAEYTSIALDALGRTHVATFDALHGALVYAFQTPSGWHREVVETGEPQAGPVGWYASLALDGRGVPHVAYYDAGHGTLKYAVRVRGAWTTEVVDVAPEGSGHYCSLALDPGGNPAISYYDAGRLSLRYAARVDGVWRLMTV